MTAWYELEEQAGRYWDRWARARASYPDHPEAEVHLSTLRESLAIYFRALGGPASMTVSGGLASDSGHRLTFRQRLGLQREPIKQARIDEDSLVLPARLAFFPDSSLNRDLYFWLTAFLAEARAVPAVSDPLQQDLYRFSEAVRASSLLADRFPGLGDRYRRLCCSLLTIRPQRRLPPVEAALEKLLRYLLGDGSRLDGRAGEMLACVSTGRHIEQFAAPPRYRPPLPVPLWGEIVNSGSVADRQPDSDPEPGADAGAGDDIRRVAERRKLEQSERDDPLLLNPFEKMLSWSEMVNVNRPVEDDEEEDARKAADQLEQLTLSEHKKQASTRLRMELEVAHDAVDETPLVHPLTYPEWHYRKRRYLPDHCAVYVEEAPEQAPQGRIGWQPDADTRRRIRRIRRQFEALRPRRELLKRQVDGEDLDLDAVVDSIAEQAAGGQGSDNVYMSWRDQARDLAVATLVDVSLSTDAWMKDRRVLDVEKEALLVLAHAVQACGDDHAIYTFTSRRRQRIDIRHIKSFEESVSSATENRIAALEPGQYTRMGAAIRHVAAALAERPNRYRLLLLLTDGKPNDTDHYEGRFAIEDTAMAVREARREGLTVFGVTIDAEARQYFPAIFGRSGYSIVARPEGLAAALPLLYRQLIS
ncbi:MAG: VWA domain-containing protein [Pseudohongiellaceae bacterium]